MPRKSKVRAWDAIWDTLHPVVRLGDQEYPFAEERNNLADVLESLRTQLTIEQAFLLGDAVKLAYDIGVLEGGK